jgi:hypothetical protein
MFGGENFSLSDVAAVTRDNDGWGGSGSWLIILFVLFFAFGGGGFGNNANGNALTQQEMQAGFNNSNVVGKLDRLGDGISSLGYDQLAQMNTLQRDLCTGFANGVAATNAAAAQAQQCCCGIERNIDSVRYDNAMNTASINANIDAKFAALEKSQLEQTVANQQNQINQLFIQSQLCGVVRYPNSTTFGAGVNPFFSNGNGYCA